jgi:hypothetical protein
MVLRKASTRRRKKVLGKGREEGKVTAEKGKQDEWRI